MVSNTRQYGFDILNNVIKFHLDIHSNLDNFFNCVNKANILVYNTSYSYKNLLLYKNSQTYYIGSCN